MERAIGDGVQCLSITGPKSSCRLILGAWAARRTFSDVGGRVANNHRPGGDDDRNDVEDI